MEPDELINLVGRPRKFKDPEELAEAADDYFQWCDDNPWIKKDFVRGGPSAGEIVDLPTQRPYTIEGLCMYLKITRETFDNYSKQPPYANFFDICIYIRTKIDAQYLEGGMAGAFNANIVAMKLGLQQKIQSTQNIVISPMCADEAAQINKAFEDAKKD